MSRRLLLFDIDGTLVVTNGVGRTAVRDALSAHVGGAFEVDGVRFSGRTDRSIMRDLLAHNDCLPSDPEEQEEAITKALAVYAHFASSRMTAEVVQVLPGVHALLTALKEEAVDIALLTGNVARMAEAKLQAVALWDHFPFGAFGDDHEERSALPDVALDAARRHHGDTYKAQEIVIIGDTEQDILCGRGHGARSVAVCTGRFSRDELAPHQPDVLFDDLEDTDRVLSALLD